MKKNLIIILSLVGTLMHFGILYRSCNKPLPPAVTEQEYIDLLQKHTEQIASAYLSQTLKLEKQNDSLAELVTQSKHKLNTYRSKAAVLEYRLKTVAEKPDSSITAQDSLRPMLETYIQTRNTTDSICDRAISHLEQSVANKSEALRLCEQVHEQYRNLTEEQRARTENLEQQLNTAYKEQRRKTIRSRIVNSCLLVVSGSLSTLLILKNMK